jgi:hypothetical protein
MGIRRARASIALAALCITLLAGCQSTEGSVSDGRYESPLKDYSVPIPVSGPGLKIEDAVTPDSASPLREAHVSFHNDFGNLVAIECAQIPASLRQVLNDPARMPEHLRRFADIAYVPTKREAFPELQTSHDEMLTLRGGVPALFMVIDFPGGSPVIVTSAEYPQGKRMDSTRPHLFFVHGSAQYILSAAQADVFAVRKPIRGDNADEEQVARWKNELVKIYESMSFR